MTSTSTPELPPPYDYCYEWDGPYGTRKFSTARHNGVLCNRSVPLYTAEQMRDYALAAVELYKQSEDVAALRKKLIAAQADATHWKANHDQMVARKALLEQRPDLPVDRIPAMREMKRLQTENAALRAALISLRAVASRYLPDYDEHPEIQKADAAIDAALAAQGERK